MTRQAKQQRIYPMIPVPAHIKVAVKAWADFNKFKMYKIGDLIENLPELKEYVEKAKNEVL